MKLFRIHTRQKLPVTADTAWDFFSDPKNLKIITPDYMGFEILSGADRPMYPGQIIQYIVKPVFGIPFQWVTEITHVVEKKYFVDEQRCGPYSIWHHKHFIHEIPDGIELEDIVDYKLPMGIFGRIAHALFIKKQLREIFEYRRNKLTEIFGDFYKIHTI